MNKYNAKKTIVDNITFASQKEGNRYKELKLLEKAGVIKDLLLQPKFMLQDKYRHDGKIIRPIFYIADFLYFDNSKGHTVIEDVKGFKNDKVYLLKKKWFNYKFSPLSILEV